MPISLPTQTWFSLFILDLVLISLVAVYAYYTYYKRLGDLKKIQADSYKKAEQILEDAKIRSQEILEKVEQKADGILTHSELFKTDINKEFKESLKKLADSYIQTVQEQSKRFVEDYENILTAVKNQSLVKSGQALDNIEEQVRKQLDEAKTGLKSEMMKSLEKATLEIGQYRKKELEKVDQEIDQVVIQMAKDLLRINLSPKDHKKLVIQALEKAKEQGMFFL